MNCGGTNNIAYEKDTCGAECRGTPVRFGTGGILPPPVPAGGYSFFTLRLGEASSGDILTPEYVSGRNCFENGAPAFFRGGTAAFYTFGAYTPNGIVSASLVPIVDGIPLDTGVARAVRTPSGLLAQTCGVFALQSAGEVSFRLDSLPVARFSDLALDLLLIRFP